MAKDKKKQLQHDGELSLWAIHRDVTAIVFNENFSPEFKAHELGNAIRSAYLLGINTDRKINHERSIESFRKSMEEITRDMRPMATTPNRAAPKGQE